MSRKRSWKGLVRGVLAFIVLPLLTLGVGFRMWGTPVVSPAFAQDPQALVSERCGICHTLKRVKEAKMGREGWESTVAKMRKLGAPLTDEEAEAIVAYLSGALAASTPATSGGGGF